MPAVLGYCMGGLLALALALRRPELGHGGWRCWRPRGIFMPSAPRRRRLHGAFRRADRPILRGPMGEVPVDVLQSVLRGTRSAARRSANSRASPKSTPDSAAAQGFVATEDWLNDGVPLAPPVARECLGGWYGEDTPGRGQWRIAGKRGPALRRRNAGAGRRAGAGPHRAAGDGRGARPMSYRRPSG